ncbi:MAG: SDR family oxidoreductase [Alphaproteobacteria bacterium]|nr:SDR family oxidoreductase [Alphaproteobacteria bacterium]MDA8004846.1 SDR family oxidoreductase [Alphaproteobacteria bacterium]MDA8006545.1 SDR family oxidoreductase [Alphaproteobacteria bacterium]MDA8013952.1 SDR family oxidoreductase [Alphaproteobacteria bacterium]
MNETNKLPETPSFRLDGKRALVTGASAGIGRACATALATAGAAVTLAARREHRLAEITKELQTRGLNAAALPLDISDTTTTRDTLAKLKPFDILLNSAGAARHGPATEVTDADFDAVIAVNLRGAFFLTCEVARRLAEAGRGGSLVNISSQMGHVGAADRALYCASKHGVEGFTKALAVEFGGADIRVNTICPTFVRTELTESTFADEEKMRWVRSKIKLPRVAGVEDIMGLAVYLASDASAMVTGAAFLVDGGWTAE